MKKTVVAVIMGAFALATSASSMAVTAHSQNWYVQGDLGFSKLRVKYDGDASSSDDTIFNPRVSVGYDFSNIRVAFDYTYFEKLKAYDDASSNSLQINSLGLSAIYDFHNTSDLTPYIGARLGYNHIKGREQDSNVTERVTSRKAGYGVLAGFQYALTDKLSLNVGAEYNRLGSENGLRLDQYGAKAGLRFDF